MTKKLLNTKLLEQLEISIKMGYYTQEEVNNYLQSKKKKTKKKKVKNKKAKIFLGYNTVSK